MKQTQVRINHKRESIIVKNKTVFGKKPCQPSEACVSHLIPKPEHCIKCQKSVFVEMNRITDQDTIRERV